MKNRNTVPDKDISNAVKKRMEQGEKEKSLGDVIHKYIERLNIKGMYKKNGKLNNSSFCKYARISNATWNELCKGIVVPSKKTLLKLVIVLRLNENEARELLEKGQNSFNPRDKRDLVILALIDMGCYDIEDVSEILEEYGQDINEPFENIYDSQEAKSERWSEIGERSDREKREAKLLEEQVRQYLKRERNNL